MNSMCILSVFVFYTGSNCWMTQSDAVVSFAPNESLIPMDCRSAGYCEKYNGSYPTAYIESKLKNFTSEYYRITESRSDTLDDEVCRTKQKVATYKVAKSSHPSGHPDHKWYFILNGPNFLQDIVVGLCRDTNQTCHDIEDEYSSKCSQQKVTRLLFALDHTGEIFHHGFNMPMYCICAIEKINRENIF